MAENEEIKNENAAAGSEEITEENISAEEETEDTAAENTETEAEKAPKANAKPAKTGSGGSKNPFRNKKFRHGTLAVVFSLIFVAAIVMVNVILRLVTDRFSLETDLSTGELFSLGEETKEYIPTVNDDIHFYFTNERKALVDSGKFGKQVVEFAERMSALNDRFSVEYVNLLTDPDFSNDYVETLQNGQVIIKSGKTNRYRILKINDFLSFTLSDGQTYTYDDAMVINYMMSYGGYTLVSQDSSAEEQMVSAIMSVSQDDPTVVTFLTGYGEADSTALEKILTDNAYLVDTKEIERIQAIPDDTDILVIFGPTYDYSLDSINKIDEWLSNNGKYGRNLIYIASWMPVETPNLNDFLSEWGIQVSNGYIEQNDENYVRPAFYGGTYVMLQDIEFVTDTDYYTNMKKANASSFVGVYVKPVIQLWSGRSNMTNTTVARTYGDDSCRLYSYRTGEEHLDSSEELSTYDIIVESSRVQFEGGTDPVYSKIIAVGGDMLFASDFMSASNYNNAEVALTLFDTNSETVANNIKIVKKSFTAQTYQITEAQQKWITLTFVAFIPAAVIILGIVVWVRRRRL